MENNIYKKGIKSPTLYPLPFRNGGKAPVARSKFSYRGKMEDGGIVNQPSSLTGDEQIRAALIKALNSKNNTPSFAKGGSVKPPRREYGKRITDEEIKKIVPRDKYPKGVEVPSEEDWVLIEDKLNVHEMSENPVTSIKLSKEKDDVDPQVKKVGYFTADEFFGDDDMEFSKTAPHYKWMKENPGSFEKGEMPIDLSKAWDIFAKNRIGTGNKDLEAVERQTMYESKMPDLSGKALRWRLLPPPPPDPVEEEEPKPPVVKNPKPSSQYTYNSYYSNIKRQQKASEEKSKGQKAKPSKFSRPR